MSDRGTGGAEGAQRLKQYEYRANSNLVLTAENRSARTNEATGEPETLWGRINQKDMGSRVARERPQELEDKLEKLKKKMAKKAQKGDLDRKDRGGPSDVMKATDQFSDTYRPKTKETKAAYEQLLVRIRGALGDLPGDILRGAADEVIAVLKNDRMKGGTRAAPPPLRQPPPLLLPPPPLADPTDSLAWAQIRSARSRLKSW